MARKEDLMALEERMDRFEKNVNIRFEQVDKRFGEMTLELKEIRKEIGVNNLKTRGDITSLDFRVNKLEKKAGF